MNLQIPARIERYAEIAFKRALKCSDGKHRMAAVTVGGGGRILTLEENCYKSGGHCEVRAVNRVPIEERENVILVIVRIRKNMKFGLAAPCSNCMEFLRKNGITEVYYSDNGTEIIKATIQ